MEFVIGTLLSGPGRWAMRFLLCFHFSLVDFDLEYLVSRAIELDPKDWWFYEESLRKTALVRDYCIHWAREMILWRNKLSGRIERESR
jgi:hypothetical protein